MSGNPKGSKWSNTPEKDRHAVKLNVRLEAWRIVQVRKMAGELKKTMGEVVALALDALEEKRAEEEHTRASEREILARVTSKPPPR